MLILYHLILSLRRDRGAPKKRVSRGRRRLQAVLRYTDRVMITGGLFGLAIALIHNELLFILLPTGLSVAVIAVTMRQRVSTLRAFLVTAAFALLYFATVTGWELVTHPTSSRLVLVTTTLAIAVLFAPLWALAQSYVEQRFHLLDDSAARTVDAFTTALREEIDLNQVRERLLDVIRATVQPRFVSMWVRAETPEVPGDASPILAAPAGDGPPPARETPDEDDLAVPAAGVPMPAELASVAVAPDDPLAAHVLRHPGVVEVARLQLESAAVGALRAREAELALPLVSQGELIGLVALGPRLDGDDYSRDDKRLLNMLAAQTAPALRVAQMVLAQQAEVRERERIDQELLTAQRIQRTFLPKEVPTRPGWRFLPYYQPAREVGGDFYDFLDLPDGRVGVVVGDVTGKGIPAALVMTAARTMLRTAAQEHQAPAVVLARVNNLLHADIPSGMFVTCFYALLDPASGELSFANAGQDLPYRRQSNGTIGELRATGMPLGLLPGTRYDEQRSVLAPGESVLFYSDGLVEAHNPSREMFGLERVARLVAAQADGTQLIDTVIDDLRAFAGPGWEQEDDVTLVTVRRLPGGADAERGDSVEVGIAAGASGAASGPGEEPGEP